MLEKIKGRERDFFFCAVFVRDENSVALGVSKEADNFNKLSIVDCELFDCGGDFSHGVILGYRVRESRIILQAPSDLIGGAAAHITARVFEVDLPATILVAATSEGAEVGASAFMHLAELIGVRSEVLRSGVSVFHCLVVFYVLKVADRAQIARFIFDYFSFPRSDHRGLRQAPDQ